MGPRKIHKRCFYFNADGSPRRGSCPKGADRCAFTHPSDPGWSTALDSDSRLFARRDRDPRSPPPRDRSPYRRRRSPSPLPSPRRYPSVERSRRSSVDYYSSRVPSHPESFVSDTPAKPRDSISSQSAAPPPTSASTLPPPSTATLTPPPSSAMPLPLPSKSLAAMPPPPSTPATEPALAPPPPLPTPPSFLTRKASATPQPTAEELSVVWAERIKLIADGVSNRQQFGKLEAEIETNRKLMATSRFPNLPDETKRSVELELAKLEAKREELKKKRDDGLALLVKTGPWPAPPLSESVEAELERQQEMLDYVAQLKETAVEMNSHLLELQERMASERGREPATPMDVDVLPDGSTRPLKRRRISDAAQAETAGPTLAEVEELLEKFNELEGRYSNFENDMIAHDADLEEEVNALIESKAEELKASTVAPTEESQAYAEVKGNLDTTGKEVEEIAEEVGRLVLQQDAHGKAIEAVKHAIETANTSLTQMQRQFQSYVEGREKDRKTIEALDTAYQAYINNPPTVSPATLTHDQLVQFLHEPLLDMVRDNVRPVIEELRLQVQDMLNQQNTEMYKTLWNKLSLTLRMVETISQRIERAELSTARA
ncbi:hypothetical protein LshimejAT787_0205090 [Lyophyllum shimeji]|uniref:C3H1-type domain-containing protein n=1 Tax=Lyophyllum shimeji TaxID=47721 RepID=A0A9P3UI50_LYOSH|nr:hypothetical protein LshimejAT787_0205090 [Lyophyllum shimeji]